MTERMKRVKKLISLLSSATLLLASLSVMAFSAAAETPARPAPNGAVAWAADFREANQKNWVLGSNWKTEGDIEGNLKDGPFHLVKQPVDVSEDGLAAKLQAGANDLVTITAYKIAGIDLSEYNTLYIKGTWNRGENPENGHAMLFVHNGLYYNTANQDPAPTKVAFTPAFDGAADNFIKVDLAALDSAAATEDIWMHIGFHLDKTAVFDIEYMFIGTADCAANAGQAKTVVDNYVAGNPAVVEGETSDEFAFDAATDTKQTFLNGAMKIGLKISDIAKMQATSNVIELSDGTNKLTWNLKNYTLTEGKINYLLLPFNEADNANAAYGEEATRIDLAKVKSVRAWAKGYEGDLSIDITGVEFVNYTDLLKSIGVVFYDAASLNSVCFTPVVDGEHGKAYELNGDIHAAEYYHTDVNPVFSRITGDKPMSFGSNVAINNLDVYLRVKLVGEIQSLSFQFCSVQDIAYPNEQYSFQWMYADAPASITGNGGWQTIHSNAAATGWKMSGDGVVDLTSIKMMRLLMFKSGDNKILVDSVMLVDSSKYTGLENLYLYAVTDLDGSNAVNYFGGEGTKPNPGTGADSVALLLVGTIAASALVLMGSRKRKSF